MAINTKVDRENLYLRLCKMDTVTKIRPAVKLSKVIDAPWVYVNQMHDADCHHYHQIYHQQLSRVHPRCLQCWKVVIRPTCLTPQMWDLYEFQKDLCKPSKLGFEGRPTVYGLWGGYFYNRSKEEGLERYHQVLEFAKYYNPRPKVLLKRGCTEFELGPRNPLGPSDKWEEPTEEEQEEQKQIDLLTITGNRGYATRQPDYAVAHVMRAWVHWAYQYGDETYAGVTGGSKLFPEYVTYHPKEEKEEEVKHANHS